MKFGHYSIEFDRTGFPLICKDGWDYSISLFPVSNYQFERFMIDNGPQGELYTDDWYREILKFNPRRSWRIPNNKIWELFITGLKLEEIEPFISYLGKGFRLPKVEEWRKLLESSDEIQNMRSELEKACKNSSAPPVVFWIKNGIFPLVRKGLLEIISENDPHSCIGKPYHGLLPNTWSSGDVKEVNWDICQRMIGFRVVKEGEV